VRRSDYSLTHQEGFRWWLMARPPPCLHLLHQLNLTGNPMPAVFVLMVRSLERVL